MPDVELSWEEHDFGGCAIDKSGEPLPESTLKACQAADAILMGECNFPQIELSLKLNYMIQDLLEVQNGV